LEKAFERFEGEIIERGLKMPRNEQIIDKMGTRN
tara:strand:- start:433 stop:534 length:102 start_codon:yes stop_codon:yes gene_type:complete